MSDLPQTLPNSPVRNLRSALEYRFELEGIPEPTIRVRVFERESIGSTEWEYVCSHWIKTPSQAGVYTPSAPFGPSLRTAIEKAMRDYATFYLGAVRAGYKPDSSWLVPSSSWKDLD